ncbi:MAG: aminotransferase, partial [Bacteroides intestinalis]|nr:aminotransferase [Bacteroides intestinalis]
ELTQIPYLHIIPSQANYFLCEVVNKYTSEELTRILIKHDVIISNCGLKSNMQGCNLIRLAIRSREDNIKLIQILERL